MNTYHAALWSDDSSSSSSDDESRYTRILPLRPLGHQAADYPTHLSPSSRAPAPHDTHLDSITSLNYLPYICRSPWFFPLELLALFHFSVLFVFIICLFINTCSLYLLPDSQRTHYMSHVS